jgi:predicted nucleotidyltransferase
MPAIAGAAVKAILREALCAWAQRTRPVAALYVFGSYARGEATETSDLDIALELAPDDREADSELIERAWAWKSELTAETGIRVRDIYLASAPCTADKVLIFRRTPTNSSRA